MKFVGRDRELALLQKRLATVRRSGQGAMLTMRGRRRVGKSRLAEEFARSSGCPYIFFTAVQESGATELDRFVIAMERSEAPAANDVAAGLRPETWEAALALAATGATRAKPLILVIDEFPYLATKEPSIEAVLQMAWDRALQNLPVLVILIGSDEAMMAALNEQGRPLFDRARDLVIRPLTPADVADLIGLRGSDALEAYLVIGGFPVLALEWGRGRGMAAYLREALADPTSFLVVSAERTLAAEFPTETQARTVLAAIGAGATSHNRILSRTGMNATSANEALHLLAEKQVIRRLTPYSTRRAPKTVLWEIVDPYMRFWLRFVNGEIDLIERGRGSLVLDAFRQGWPSFRGQAVEPLVRDSLDQLLPDRRFGAARHTGGYWNRTGSIEVDLVGGDERPRPKQIAFIGSIKWRQRRPFTRADALRLAAQREQVPGADEATALVGVSSRGFDEAVPLDVALSPEALLDAWRD